MKPARAPLRIGFAFLSLAAASAGQAVQLRLGLQGAGMAVPLADGSAFVEGGLHFSVQNALSPGSTVQLRGVVEAGVTAAGSTVIPSLRVDADLLNQGSYLYYGGGFGSGVLVVSTTSAGGIPDIVYTPLLYLNAHAFLGRDFGAFSLEGLVRVGLLNGVSLRASIPLN